MSQDEVQKLFDLMRAIDKKLTKVETIVELTNDNNEYRIKSLETFKEKIVFRLIFSAISIVGIYGTLIVTGVL